MHPSDMVAIAVRAILGNKAARRAPGGKGYLTLLSLQNRGEHSFPSCGDDLERL